MESIIERFYETLSEKISLTYNKELFSVFDNMPRPIINFNDVELLKKAQLYVRHTDLVFNKVISKMVKELFEYKGIKAGTPSDRNGKCVFVYPLKTSFHFLSIEKFAGFPHVPWIKEFASSGSKGNSINDIYIVLIKSDNYGKDYVKKLNCNSNTEEQKFFIFEDFIVTMFGDKAWTLISNALYRVQKDAEELQWFELAKTSNPKNIKEFNESLKKEIENFDYYAELEKTSIRIDRNSFNNIGNRFLSDKLYLRLFDYTDYSKSFLTSEWLYKNTMKNDLLEKTYVITGYLKSVEQLLYTTISRLETNHKISILDRNGIKEVSLDSPDFLKATLGNMVHFLKNFENRDIYHSGISRMSITGISLIIGKWVQSERNGYFHKHNMNDIEKVQEIRNNTLLLYYLILGSLGK